SDEEKERNEAAETKEPEKESEKEPVTLLSLIEAHDTDGLHRYFDAKETIDIAQEAEELSDEELAKLPDMLTDDEMAALMEESEDEERIRIAHMLDNRRLLLAFHYMQKDDIVDILGDFPTGRQKDVINLMKTDDRKIITDLLKYPEDSAGGIMTTGYLVLKEERTVEQGLERIREVGPKTEYIDTIYIIDAHRKVVGQIGLRDLLSSPRSTFIKNIMDRHVISVTPETDQEEAARLVSRYDLKALPVVSRGQMLGIITLDDIIDVIVDEADEDILQMGGVNKEESLDTPMWESVKLRLPWLLINLLTAFLASAVVKAFENTISQVVALSAIMTIISGMGGNAGTQTMSIVVRHLSKEDIDWKTFWHDLGKELMVGLIDGAVNGAITGLVVLVMYHNVFLFPIVLMSMIGNLLIAGLFGLLVPVLIQKCHADPAIASSIFLTTATDCLGFFIFLGLAQIFMPLLL
ncbi:MAG: magnesium transporter, partial [Lachnospiraceae bacterium]|nr:magnesium transporter [Lachnospiraceae bacterium]